MVALETGAVIAGRYQLVRPLAQGGMGAVWVARHLQLDTEVAIKFLASEHAASPELRARFEREAKAAARLKLPNVIQVHDYGIESDTPYLVMELLEGEDLRARLARATRLGPAATLAIVEPVCKVLGHAHGVGLVHRDLKPGNIFLARHGGDEIVKILDFGIAKDTGLGLVDSVTKTGTLLGSPQYMSPEQVRRRKDIDHRSDLWSLGVIVFECLTGRLPFQSEELGDLLVAICSEDVPPASRIVPELGPAIDAFLARALTREPEERFQSAQAFAHAFHAAASATPAPTALDIGFATAPTLPWLPLGAPARSGGTPAETLAPSGGTLARPPGRNRAVAIGMALLGATVTLGPIAFTILRSTAPEEDTALATEPAAPSPAGAPAELSPAAPPPAPRSTADPGAPATATPRTPDAPDASAPTPSPQKPAPRRAPAPTKPRKPGHDPLDQP